MANFHNLNKFHAVKMPSRVAMYGMQNGCKPYSIYDYATIMRKNVFLPTSRYVA
jgi:hypothetical protein